MVWAMYCIFIVNRIFLFLKDYVRVYLNGISLEVRARDEMTYFMAAQRSYCI
jgi:hypothetical protein